MRITCSAINFPLYHLLCLGAIWIGVTSALSSAELPDHGSAAAAGSLNSMILEPNSNSGTSTNAAPPPAVRSRPLNLIHSRPTQSNLSSLSSTSGPIALTVPSPVIVTTAPFPNSVVALNPPYASLTDVTTILTSSQGNATGTLPMISTVQGLRPIPPAVTEVGDPNGHHEIPEPNFSSTRPCRGCSPVYEIPATGWLDTPVGEQHGSTIQEATAQATTERPPQITISAGASDIVVDQNPSGGGFVVGGSLTLTPGDTVTIGDTPVAIETSDGKTKIVVGTTIISLLPFQSATTDVPVSQPPIPLPPILTIGTQTIAPNSQTQYVIAGQTLLPGGEPLTISGTTLALASSATALIVNGRTTSITPIFGNVYTTVAAALTYGNHVYTPNRAGYIVMGPGTTLVPGGAPITVNGTTLSLDHSGTAVVVQGATRTLQPITTIATLTREPDPLGTGCGVSGGSYHGQSNGYLYPTGGPVIAGTVRAHSTIAGSWPAGLLLLLWWGVGILAIRL